MARKTSGSKGADDKQVMPNLTRAASTNSTVSLPFEAGENKKVAVKIVDDRGIESLKIIPLD